MKPEQSEQFLIEELISQSIKNNKIESAQLRQIDKLTGDASTRRYYRAFTNKLSYVVCLDNPLGDGEKNLFVEKQKFFIKRGISVPKVFDKNLSRGYILEEDLGDVTLLTSAAKFDSLEHEKNIYMKALDELIKIHSVSISDAESKKMFTLSFDEKKLNEEIEFTIKFFIKKYLGYESDVEDITYGFKSICHAIASKKMVLTHRDFHSRNIMMKDDKLQIIDFQDARWGIPQYDLCSLLDDCYYQVDNENKKVLIEYYFNKMRNIIADQDDLETFYHYYSLTMLQRVFKAIGSFSYIYELRKDERYLKYIGFAMEKIKNTLLHLPQYKDLRKQLISIYYEN